MKLKALITSLMLVVAFAAASAPVALAVTRAQASQILKDITRTKSACGQGFWTCTGYAEVELSGTGGGAFSGTGMIYRGHPGSREEACLVTAIINSGGGWGQSSVSCKPISDN